MALTAHQEVMKEVWHQHGYAEFGLHDPDAAIATMNDNPYILAVPLGQLLYGRQQVYEFYRDDFLCKMPSNVEMEPLLQVIGENHIADQFILRFTHDAELPWQIPGIAPTGKDVEIVLDVFVGFDGDKIAFEHLNWNHGLLMQQIGLVDHPQASIAAASVANLRKVLGNHGVGAS